MATYLHPGVYVEEIPSGSKPIEGVATSVAAFVGYTTKGPLGEPTRITKYDAYDDEFGGTRDTGPESTGDPMGHGVLSFFQNGGTTAYIVRITHNWEDDDKDAKRAVGYMDHPSPENTTQALEFTAVNEGDWANGIVASLSAVEVAEGAAPVYDVSVGRYDSKGGFEADEKFSNVSLNTADPQFIGNVINGVSALVEFDLVEMEPAGLPAEGEFLGTSTSGDLSGLTANDLDLSGLSDEGVRTLVVALDGTAARSYTISEQVFANLAELATAIQTGVRGGATTEPRASFTCVAEGNHLVLTSGSRIPKSSVVVEDFLVGGSVVEGGIAEALSLGATHGGVEMTGEETARAAWETPWDKATLADGANGSPPVKEDYDPVFEKFVKIREISVMVLPGQPWSDTGSGNSVVDAAISHAEHMKSRVVIVDPPEGPEFTAPKEVADIGLPTSTYTALYYPWVKVANPFFHPERNPGVPKTVLVAPSGFAAGMWSKIDARRGVWKAPAGVETRLLGVAGLQHDVEDGEQDVLNPLGVNAIRTRPNFGSVIWGARTLSTKADPEWRYVSVRRTAIMIEQSIYGGIQWAVFEPNDHRLWSALRTNIDGFMNGLFRSGAFQGQKASDAYFVRCGKGDTMTPGDIDAGRVIVIVGFAPLKPAEFVIVRIQQKVGQ